MNTQSLEERKKFNKGTRKEECVLSKCFVQQMNFVEYVRYNPMTQFEFEERLKLIINDLQELLSMAYEQFWCQVIFEPTILKCVDSYLQNSPRWYDFDSAKLSEEGQSLHDELHRFVFMVMLRCSTNKESDADFVSPQVHGDLIYENFIFDISKLMDICILYGEDNLPLVTKMVENIFKNQPLYKDDFMSAIQTIKRVMGQLCDQCKTIPTSVNSPIKLNSSLVESPSVSEEALLDMLNYLLDISLTVKSFIAVCGKELIELLLEENFEVCIASLYENCLPHIEERLKSIDLSTSVKDRVSVCMSRISDSLTKIVKIMVLNHFLNVLLESRSREEKSQIVEQYIHTMSILSPYKQFVGALEVNDTLTEEIDIVLQAASLTHHADSTPLIHNWSTTLRTLEAKYPNHPYCFLERQSQPMELNGQSNDQNNVISPIDLSNRRGSYSDLVGACAAGPPTPPGEKLDSMISSVSDVIPNLGEGFIQACLENYDYNFEKVINALLEGSLPPYLDNMDRQLPKTFKEESSTGRWNDLADHLTHFTIHIGKKEDGSRAAGLSADIKSKIISACKDDDEEYSDQEYKDVNDEILNAGLHNLEYEDEYDDTYDSTIAAVEPDNFTEKRDNNMNRYPPANHDHFVENPEVVRQRLAQRRASKMNANPKPQRERNVEGNARGKGQSQEVLRDRLFKQRHKGQQANHNRRNLSDRKNQKGMF